MQDRSGFKVWIDRFLQQVRVLGQRMRDGHAVIFGATEKRPIVPRVRVLEKLFLEEFLLLVTDSPILSPMYVTIEHTVTGRRLGRCAIYRRVRYIAVAETYIFASSSLMSLITVAVSQRLFGQCSTLISRFLFEFARCAWETCAQGDSRNDASKILHNLFGIRN